MPPSSPTKKPLKDLFLSMYHDKFEFSDFASGNIEENYSKFEHRERDKVRTILKPNKKLKTFHTFLNLFLFEKLPINEHVVFSYRRGFSAFDAVSPHRESKHFFQSDIRDFFGSIDQNLVRQTIEDGKALVPISDVDAYIDRILEIVCVDGSLPLGLPASTTISNSVLKAFDDATEMHSKSIGCIYTRYSDDIIISAPTREPLEALREHLAASLKLLYGPRFELNSRKSKLFKVAGKVSILGLALLPNGRITVDSRVRNEIEILLHLYLTDREACAVRAEGDIDKASERIAGFLNYVNATDGMYLDKLRRKYGATTVDMFLHRAFD